MPKSISPNWKRNESAVRYKAAIVAAVQQVDDAIETHRAEQERLKNLNHALAAAHQATKLATERYDRGLTNYLNVLDAERQEFDLEDQTVSAQRNAAEQLGRFIRRLAVAGSFIKPCRQSRSRSQPSLRRRSASSACRQIKKWAAFCGPCF